jgi:dTDP-4-dehydrorhamnose 3,5-epimerase-like enzyme/dTDP-4-dehydrorhamnose reductase
MSKFNDKRGTLIFPIKNNSFISKETTVSINNKNVFRGIHMNLFNKLVTCISGKILDIIINFNKEEEDYLIPKYYTLDPTTDFFQILVPKNHGHAFFSLEDNSILVYNFDETFDEKKTTHYHYLDPYLNIKLPIENPIISDKDNVKNFTKPIDYLIFGSKGFLGSNIVELLQKENKHFITTNLRLHQLEEIKHLLDIYKPKYIINCAGITGSPNIFWCDKHKEETIENNITYQLTLAEICKEKNIHLTIFGSGGIFKEDRIYSEKEEGNFKENFYGECRINLESIIKNYENVLYLRVNYPICSKKSTKNLLTKLISYNTIEANEFSITYVDNLFPILFKMIENNEVGICNFTNPGTINIIEIMNIYKKKNKEHNFEILVVDNTNNKRSFAKLFPQKLLKYNPLSIEEAIHNCIEKYK